MLNAPDITPQVFEKFLPYAIALDCEDAWSKKFESGRGRPVRDADEGLRACLVFRRRLRAVRRRGVRVQHRRLARQRLGFGVLLAVFRRARPVSAQAPAAAGFSGGGGGGGGGSGW